MPDTTDSTLARHKVGRGYRDCDTSLPSARWWRHRVIFIIDSALDMCQSGALSQRWRSLSVRVVDVGLGVIEMEQESPTSGCRLCATHIRPPSVCPTTGIIVMGVLCGSRSFELMSLGFLFARARSPYTTHRVSDAGGLLEFFHRVLSKKQNTRKQSRECVFSASQ